MYHGHLPSLSTAIPVVLLFFAGGGFGLSANIDITVITYHANM
jgi:hypothetical protein